MRCDEVRAKSRFDGGVFAIGTSDDFDRAFEVADAPPVGDFGVSKLANARPVGELGVSKLANAPPVGEIGVSKQ